MRLQWLPGATIARAALVKPWRILQRSVNYAFDRGDTRGLVHQFKPDAASIEEAPIPLPAFAALYVVLALITVAIFWSILGSVDRIVVAQGRIVTTTPVIVMQPFTTSRILALKVRAGDHVKKGQTLVTFDPAFAQADQTSLEGKVRALSAEQARIEAELAGKKVFSGGAELEMRQQADLFARRVSQFNAELAQRDSRERQVDVQIDSNNKSIDDLRREYELAHKVAEIRRQLQAQNAGSALELMAAEKDEVDFDLRLKNAISDRDKFVQQKAEIVAERQSFLSQWRSDLNQRLVSVHQDLQQASEDLKKASRLRDFAELKAPVDAVVLELADVSVGSVLREAETLVTLVPDDAPLDLEADVLSRDVGYVARRDPVRVKLEAYPFQQYGTLDGRLDVISPDSVPVREGDRNNVVFHVQVHLNETVGRAARQGIRLRPGLVASAEINTGTQSIASYVLAPIIQTFDESLREP